MTETTFKEADPKEWTSMRYHLATITTNKAYGYYVFSTKKDIDGPLLAQVRESFDVNMDDGEQKFIENMKEYKLTRSYFFFLKGMQRPQTSAETEKYIPYLFDEGVLSVK